MVSYKKHFLKIIFVFLLSSSYSFGQKGIDTLKGNTFLELFEIINNCETLKKKTFYTNYLIKKAKNEKNEKFLIAGYHTQAIIHNDDVMLKFCDSIIELTSINEDEVYPLEAYQLKGDFYYKRKKYKTALDNYLQVSFYANKYKNKKQIFDSNYNIGIIKRKINEKESALVLFKENYQFALKNLDEIDTEDFLLSITSLANIYNDLNLPDSASTYNKKGIYESKRLKNKAFFNHFSLNEGVSFYYRNDYNKAIDSLEKYIPYFENNKRKANLSIAYYYCGESYLALKNESKAILYFKKLDTVFQVNKSIYPVSRNAYEHLISYYKKKGDVNNQLVYINKLLKVDSILHSQEIYLNKKIFKEYDIPKLKSEKETILKAKKETEINFFVILSIVLTLLLIITGFLIYQNKKRKFYKIRVEEILNEEILNTTNNKPNNKDTDIPKEIVSEILLKLEKFESDKEYLSKKVTLNSLAKKIDSNTNYLSKTINHYKNKSFSNYINSLKIKHITQRLKKDLTLRKFTIKAIASEAGFNNSESFSKAFEKINGIKPSYFLRELDKFSSNN
jgi:AraC-like DNA-binding protein/TolA-binding protein